MGSLYSLHKTGFRLLKMIHQEDSSVIPLHLLKLCLCLIQIHAGLFFTARLIDALAAGEYRQAGINVAMFLGVNGILEVSIHLLTWRFRELKTKLWLTFYVWLRQKAFSVDYETMEKPMIWEKILFSERTSEMYGGLGVLLEDYCEILQSALNMAISLSLIFLLCLTRPEQNLGFLRLLAAPLSSVLMFAGIMAAMMVSSWSVFCRFSEKQMELFRSHTGVENRMTYFMTQVFGNRKAGKIIRLYGMEDMILQNAVNEEGKSHDYFERTCNMNALEKGINQGISSLFLMGSYLLIAIKAVTGAISVGAFTRYAGAVNQFGNSCFTMISHHGDLRKICTYMEEFLAFLDIKTDHAQGTIPVEKRTDGEYELAFEHVSFRYPGSEQTILHDINLNIRIRGKLAVVGKNGAGKTTFIKLLCRLYEPTEGRITLNGIDIRKYREEEYFRLFGVVFQDFKLFALPIWENIRAGYERDDEKIWRSLKLADAEDFVKGMEKQLDTCLYRDLEDGVEISGGEAQKLALARALYKDAPIVILDEPTAALDPKAEAQVYAHFNQMIEGRTAIYISHRMSSCRFCDEIIVFEDGRITERGSHEQLLSAGNGYARMWNAQAKYYYQWG